MAGYMDILENNIRALFTELIDNIGDCFFISGNRMGAEHNQISRLNGYLLVNVRGHSGKRGHRLSLAARSNKNHLLVRIILHLVDVNQRVLRNIQVAKL